MQTVREVSEGQLDSSLAPGWWSQEDGGICGLAWLPHHLHWEMQETDDFFFLVIKMGGNNNSKSHIWVISYRSSYCGIPSFFLRDFVH